MNAYKFIDAKKEIRLSNLINRLSKIEELKRIRYTTSHPKDMTQDLIQCYKNSNKLMPFLHLPVQSGSDRILNSMNRKHTSAEYLSTINKLLRINPEIKFSSDFIVGYPGETEKDFNETISLIKKVNFINSYSFIYSSRPGTPASNLATIDKEIQKKRLVVLQNLLRKIQMNKNKKEVGKIKEVLVENRMKNRNQHFGRTRDLTPVILSQSKDSDIGKILDVKIEECNQNSLFGRKKIVESEAAA